MSGLETQALTVHYGTGARALRAVDRVSVSVSGGEVLGIVGESGSGKSTLARAIVGLVPFTGRVLVGGDDLATLPRARRRRVQLVFQDAYASLNPRMSVGATLAEAASARRGNDERVAELLELVSLDAGHAVRLPRELSGGQCQRVAIARALAVQPDVLIADEITSALDVSVQGAVLNLLREIQERLGLTVLFISHDLSLIRYVSDSTAVMYLGRMVETGAVDEVLTSPRHPYTRALLDSVPQLDGLAKPALLEGDPPDASAPPAGCHFHPRCPVGPRMRSDRSRCAAIDPWPGASERPHQAACHYAV